MLNGVDIGSRVRYIGRSKRDLPHGFESTITGFGMDGGGGRTGAPMIKDKSGALRLRARKDWEEVKATTQIPATPIVTMLDNRDAKIAELEAFKERALAKYPDLDVPPTTLRAREIAANRMPEKRLEFIAGAHDRKPMILAIIDALNA